MQPAQRLRVRTVTDSIVGAMARVSRTSVLGAVLVAGGGFLLSGCAPSGTSDGAAVTSADGIPAQRHFDSPEAAVESFIEVARRGDVVAARAFFGPGVEELESDSFDKTQGDLQRFAAAYDRDHRLFIDAASTADGTTVVDRVTLAVGDDLWEFPVPLVRDGTPPTWRFDTATGVANVLEARFASNRDSAIELLVECIAAQEEFRRLNPQGTSSYAKRFRSDRGERNGLWWPDDLAPPVSPIGPMVDEAVAAAAQPVDLWSLRSYRGYTYRVLTGAGASAPGGAQTWLDANGNLAGGFAFLAWPATYGETGVESVLVAMDGTVWVNDLGSETSRLVESITTLDPGAGWVMLASEN